jgi:peptidylprolyl isomerase
MKPSVLILLLAASTVAASAQTSAKPSTTAAKPATTAAKAAKNTTATEKLPFGVPAPGIPAVKTAKQTLFTVSLRYQEIKAGDGAVAEPGKIYKILYTGWLAADGHKFDSTDDHPRPPLKDKDGKPLLGADGQPVQGPPQPISFPQGFGRVIPGFDHGFDGMRIGGQRRLFIPWQLAYGAKGRPGPDATHPGIPPKADLIFDVTLVDVTDLPTQPARPPAGGMHPMSGGHATPETHPVHEAATAPAAPAASAAPVATPALANTSKSATAPAVAPAAQNATPVPATAPSTPAQPQSK